MELQVLIITAVSIGFIHTLIGPDHYLPFIMLGRARNWSLGKTTMLTVLCGIGHVFGSVVLGIIGIALGVFVGFLEKVETVRGDIASWLLIGFGVAYTVWGLRIGLRAKEHAHEHKHDAAMHQHAHHHLGSHAHIHGDPKSTTPWILFIIFILGPCEPLIPILMYPASQGSWLDLAWVTVAFGVTTILTMSTIVVVASKGLLAFRLGPIEQYAHALAGIIIAASGLMIKFLGL